MESVGLLIPVYAIALFSPTIVNELGNILRLLIQTFLTYHTRVHRFTCTITASTSLRCRVYSNDRRYGDKYSIFWMLTLQT